MSELIDTTKFAQNRRIQLLASASVAAMIGTFCGAGAAWASEPGNRPTVWVELGGQFEQIDTDQGVFVPPFFAAPPSFTSITPSQAQRPLDYGYALEGKLSFEPGNSGWTFSAAIRYGRSNGKTHAHQSTTPAPIPILVGGEPNGYYITRKLAKFADVASSRSEDHLIADFMVGRDVGLGLFGRNAETAVSIGARFAQFHSSLQASLGLEPSAGGYKYFGTAVRLPTTDPHTFFAAVQSSRSFHGIGPAVAWDGSVPIAGSAAGTTVTFDFGVNAAVLFGRQKSSTHHHTSAQSRPTPATNPYQLVHTLYQRTPPGRLEARSVTVPNIGGMVGISLGLPNAKISLGYRADFFFGPMDGGVDTRESETVGFYGPFANISIGLGG